MTVEEEMTLCKEAHLQKIEKDQANIARIALEQLETNPNIKRTIDELKSLPKSPHDDSQDAAALASPPTTGILGAAAVLLNPKLREKVHVDIPREPDIFKPTKSMLDILSERIDSDLNKRLTEFGETNGFPVVFVFYQTIKNENGVSKATCDIKMYKRSDMHDAVDFARSNGGELGLFNSYVKYIDELNPQPVLDGPLPKFCIAHHCTKRSKACDKCAYTAFSSSHRRWLEG